MDSPNEFLDVLISRKHREEIIALGYTPLGVKVENAHYVCVGLDTDYVMDAAWIDLDKENLRIIPFECLDQVKVLFSLGNKELVRVLLDEIGKPYKETK